jgi:hypothetical protein
VSVYGNPATSVALASASLAGGAAHALETAAAQSKASVKPVETARRRSTPTFLPRRRERNLLVIATLLSVADRASEHGRAGRLQLRATVGFQSVTVSARARAPQAQGEVTERRAG